MSQAIAESVLKHAGEHQAKKVLQVEIEIGQLSLLNPEQVEMWVNFHFDNTIANGVKLNIKVVEPEISCRECKYNGGLKMESEPEDHFFLPSFSCPQCNSGNIKIERGRECLIRRIELVK